MKLRDCLVIFLAAMMAFEVIVTAARGHDRASDRLALAKLSQVSRRHELRGVNRGKTIQLGSLTMERCMEHNSFSISDIYCYNLTVPVDYKKPNGEQMKVAFMVHLASDVPLNSNTPRRAMVMPSGGPGTVTHMGYPAKYTYSYGPESGMDLARYFDLVFIDQRGMGWSCGMWCVNAYQWISMMPYDPANSTSYAQAVSIYRDMCRDEMIADNRQTAAPCIINSTLSPVEQRDLVVPNMGTANAARDIEMFRIAAGYDKIWVAGRSYGTAVAQVYGGLFPAHIDGLLLDSTIDERAPIDEQDAGVVVRRLDFLVRTIELCAADPICSQDMPETTSYLELVENALGLHESWPMEVSVPATGVMAGRQWVQRQIIRWHLEFSVLNWEASPWSRGDIARALIRAARGDRMGLLRMLWGAWGMDVETEMVDVQATLDYSDEYTAYYMVYGADYSFRFWADDTTTKERVVSYFARHERDLVLGAMGTTYMMDAADAAYNPPNVHISTPEYINATVPTPGWHGDYRILIVGPSIDPFTSDADAETLSEYYGTTGPTKRIILEDGPHVSGGKTYIEGPDPGFYCVNEAIDAYVFAEQVPSNLAPTTTCTMQTPFQNYIPTRTAPITNAADVPKWIDAEVVSLPEFRWYTTNATGCDYTGYVSWHGSANWRYDLFELNNCQFFPGFKVSGTGSFDWLSTDLYTLGADTTFDLKVTNTATGDITCYNYARVAGQAPTTTARDCKFF